MEDGGKTRLARGWRASMLGMACNIALFAAKLLVGLAAGSVAVVADGVNNLTDAASNIIGFLGFKLAARPADAEHPYGHGRYEYLAGLTVAVLVMVAGVELFRSGVEELIHPTPVAFSWLLAAALAVSAAVKLGMMIYYRRVGRAIGSETLAASAADSRNDAIATGAVLAGMLASWRWNVALDGVLALAVAVFVLASGVSLIRKTLDPLLGGKPSPALVGRIREQILACPGVLGTHDLMIHDYGPGRRFASAHVEVPAETDVMATREMLEGLARAILEAEGVRMLFQYDPISGADTAENRLREHLAGRMTVIDGRLTVHDLRLRRVDGVMHVKFDCFVPPDVTVPEAEIVRMLENIVREIYPDAVCAVTLDRDYMSAE